MNNSDIKYIFFDLEATGLPINYDYSHLNIIEIAWVITDNKFNIINKFNYFINGDFIITDFIQNLTGISKQLTINKGYSLNNILNLFFHDLKNCDILIAHNINYDYNLLKSEIKKLINLNDNIITNYHLNLLNNTFQLCSLYIFKNEFNLNKLIITNYKLNSIYHYLIRNDTIQTHRALDDVIMIIDCFKTFNNLNLIKYILSKPIYFGKYKYKSLLNIKDIDKNYFNWIISNKYNFPNLSFTNKRKNS